MPLATLTPAVVDCDNGAAYATLFGDSYHARGDGLAEKRHVFLRGNRLPERWQGVQQFQIVEVGFGLGLNFLATWLEWRRTAPPLARLHYFSAERHPLSTDDLRRLLSRWPELSPLANELVSAWPPLTPGFHRRHFDQGRVNLTLMFDDAADALRQADVRADAIYLDGFAPSRNPAAWSPELARALARLATHQATLATYTVAAAVRDNLTAVGFALNKCPGWGHKREMLTGSFRPQRPRVAPQSGSVAVIGAGLAGCAVASRLAARGWDVALFDRHPQPAAEASGNAAGAFGPHPSKDDNHFSRLVRAGLLYGLYGLGRLRAAGCVIDGEQCGKLQLATMATDTEAQQVLASQFAQPREFLRWVDQSEASDLAGQTVAAPGLFHALAGWVNPPSLCRAWCQVQHLTLRTTAVDAVLPSPRGWRLLAGSVALAEVEHVVFASGSSGHFPMLSGLPLRQIRGQISQVPDTTPLRCVVGGEGYVIPGHAGWQTVGATYERDAGPADPTCAGHEQNRGRLLQLLPDWQGPPVTQWRGRVAVRCASRDHLPLVGALPNLTTATDPGQVIRKWPRIPGLWVCLGFGSRGLVWADMAAEMLATRMSGEPAALEQELVDSLDPARFQVRHLRRGSPTHGSPASLSKMGPSLP